MRQDEKSSSFQLPLLNLNPNQIPAIPPTAVNSTEDIYKKSDPHKRGMKLPTAEPMTIKIQIVDFELINL